MKYLKGKLVLTCHLLPLIMSWAEPCTHFINQDPGEHIWIKYDKNFKHTREKTLNKHRVQTGIQERRPGSNYRRQ